MANNRLYLGDRNTKDYIFLEKGWGCGWDGGWFDGDLMQKFIEQVYSDGGLGEPTSLIIFSEYDEVYDDFMENGFQVTKERFIMTKYKGKNVRISGDVHERLVTQLPKKIIIGAFVDEAIAEKLDREGIPTLERQDFTVKKETQVIKYK